jgi:hypothetical protein
MPRQEVDPEELRKLTAIFAEHGAPDPEGWARSQLANGIPQLAIFCFAKALWDGVVREGDTGWIEREIEARGRSGFPSGPALEEMLAKGVSREAITDLVRTMQYCALFQACCLIDGVAVANLPVNQWTLFQVDDDGKSVALIQGLNEVLMSLDPTGREMGPRRSK